MINNQIRRELLTRHKQSGYPGSIIDVLRAAEQGVDLIGQYMMQQQQMMQQQPQVASTPEQYEQGLRPAHQAGNTNQSMIFPNVPPNTPFNTVGMKAPINIQKFDEQGHLVKSYENVPPGVQSLPTGPHRGTVIETPANMQSGGGRRLKREALNMFPALKALGNVKVKADTEFTKEKTGIGDIEYFAPGQEVITYPTGERVEHPGSDRRHTVLVNPDTNNAQNVALDMLHGLAAEDPTYSRLREEFGEALGEDDPRHFYELARAEGLAEDGYEQYRQNYIDGKLRNLLFQGSKEEFENNRYNSEERAQIQQYNPIAYEKFLEIESHLKSPKKTKKGRRRIFQSAGEVDLSTYTPPPQGSLNSRGEVVYTPEERKQLFPDGTPAQQARAKSDAAVGSAAFEFARIIPGLDIGIDVAEAAYAGKTGKDFYGDEVNPTALAGMTGAGLFVPNIIERPLKWAYRKGKRLLKGAENVASARTATRANTSVDAPVRRKTDGNYYPILQEMEGRGKKWDELGVGTNPNVNWGVEDIGEYEGRRIVRVRADDGTSQLFYKSTGWGGKYMPDGTSTEGMWQPFGGMQEGAHRNLPDGWFIKASNKEGGVGFEDYYGSESFKAISNQIEGKLKKRGGPRKFQSAGALEFGQTGPDFETYGPGLRIDGETYQASRETGSTRIPLFSDGTQRPILLGAAEVYDEPISSVPQDYTPETKALADEGAAGVAARRNQGAMMGLSAAGDYFSTLQRYGVSAPLSLAMGKKPNLSATPLLDRALGAESPNAFPSEILGVQNPYGAMALDVATDPMAAFGLATMGKVGAAKGMATARNFRDLRYANQFAKKYGYAREYRPSYSNMFSTENTDKAIRELAEQHNTVTRGVSTDISGMADNRQSSVADLLSNAGIDPLKVGPGLDPVETKKAAEYFMTHYAGDTGFGRAGTSDFLSKNKNKEVVGTLYTSNSPETAHGYTYGEGYVADLRRQGLDFSGPRKNWLDVNDWKTVREYKNEKLGDVILGERYIGDPAPRRILKPYQKQDAAVTEFFKNRDPIQMSFPGGRSKEDFFRSGFLKDKYSKRRFDNIFEEEKRIVADQATPELSRGNAYDVAFDRAAHRFGMVDRLDAMEGQLMGESFGLERSFSKYGLPEVQRSTSLSDRLLHSKGLAQDALRYNWYRSTAQPRLDIAHYKGKYFPSKTDDYNNERLYSHFIFTGKPGEKAPLDILNMRQVSGQAGEIGGAMGPTAGGRLHEGLVGKYSVNYKSGGPRKFQPGGAVAESTRNNIFVPDFELLQASRETKEFNERQKQIERLNDQGEIKPAGRGAPPNAMAFMPPGLQYNQTAAGKYIEENPLSNPVSTLALGATAAIAAPALGETAVGRTLAKPYIDKPLRYGFGAHSAYDLSNIRNWEGDGQAMMERLGTNMLGLAGIAPELLMLKSAIGQAGRNALYYSVDPLGYAPKIYGPRGAWKNYKDPLGRPARVTENINTSYYTPFGDKRLGQSAAERRLDIWSASLGRTPDYGTLTHLGRNKYSLAGEHVNLHGLRADVERSLRAQEYARQMQQYKAAVAAGDKSAKPPAKIDWADFEGYSPHHQRTHFKGHRISPATTNKPSARILSNEKTRVTNLQDETFNVMAGYELELLHPKLGNIHDPSRIAGIQAASPGSNVVQDFRYHNRPLTVTMRDTWDLHPFQSQIFQDKFLRGLPERMQRGIVDRFKNTEAISAVGGKPLDLRTTFHVENPLAMEGRNATFTHTHTGRKYEVGPFDGTALSEMQRQMFEMEAKALGSKYNKPYVQSVGPFEQIPTSINRPGDVPGYMPPFWMRK